MLNFIAMPTSVADAFKNGAPDANGQPAERMVSDGGGHPCRHCLKDIPAGNAMLLLSYRPFDGLQAYAETGPVFLCADQCPRHESPRGALPQAVAARPAFMFRAYDGNDRIIEGSGSLVRRDEMPALVRSMLARPEARYAHLRSATNGCYLCRVEFGG